MEKLFKDMSSVLEEVVRVQTNYKKDSEDRKNISYLNKRIEKVQNFHKQMEMLNNKIIKEYAVTEANHQYFETNYFKKCQKLCFEILEVLMAKLKERLPEDEINCDGSQLIKSFSDEEKDDDDKLQDISSKQTIFTINNQQNKIGNILYDSQAVRYNRQEAKIIMINRNIKKLNEDLNNTQTTAGVLKKKLELLNKYWEAFSTTHDDIAANVTDQDYNNPYFKNNLYEIIEEDYLETIIRVEDRLDSIMLSKSNKVTENHTIKLPTIEIPSFHGDYTKWRSFHDVFKKLIHENQSLTDIHRMNYLKTSISGSASKLISHLSIAEENYNTAWNILKQRYENKRLIASNHINAILSLQSCSAESIPGLRTIHDTTKENLHALENLGIKVDTWGPIIIQILTQKLDRETHKLYETTLTDPRQIQETSSFLEFLEQRFQSLEAVNFNYKRNIKGNSINQTEVAQRSSNYNQNNNFLNANRNQQNNTNKYQKNSYFINSNNTEETKSLQKSQFLQCWKCNANHALKSCTDFQKLTIRDRVNFVNQNKLCFNCLSSMHPLRQCTSIYRCCHCKGRHHSLLHEVNIAKNAPTQQSTHISTIEPTSNNNFHQVTSSVQQSLPRNIQVQSHIASNISQNGNILLGTALVRTVTKCGSEQLLRMLIDSGSQATFITEDACQRLNLNKQPINAEISGMGGITAGVARNMVQLNIQPRFPSEFSLNINAIVFKRLTKQLPEQRSDPWQWNHLQNLLWADPNFASPGPIDIIIGADYYSDIILNEIVRGHQNQPIAQKTQFGWTILGKTGSGQQIINIQSMITQTEIDNQLKSFWELEEIHSERQHNQEEIECEKFYEESHTRGEDGRYTVQIPFKDSNLNLGNSRNTAVARLLQVEKRLAKDVNLRKQYQEFMDEYIKLNHMKLVNSTYEVESTDKKHFFLPHHPVIKESSTTTKLRVVFDGSAKTTSGNSLNDLMMTGPTIQQDIISIILRWRKHKYVYTADIEKMFRQINLTDDHQNYHKILWRESTNEPIKEYNLTTVTYGTTAATYLSVKTLQQLAVDDRSLYPIASKIVLNDFYVDDLMSGNDTIEAAIIAQNQLTRLLKGGGFNLRKWSSNNREILKNLPEESRAFSNIEISKDETVKTLGISWNPTSDTFEFKVNLQLNQKIETKRKVLSEVAKLFDPLGWHAPTIISAKILLQDLWLAGVTWDEPLPKEIMSKWSIFRNTLSTTKEILSPLNELVQRCSTIRKLVSIIAYCKRYLHNLKHKHERKSGSLTTTELNLATKCLIKHIQTEEYMDDIKFYQQSKMFNHKSKIISLNPFIDEDNIIRVGGRLQQSSFGYNQTHPIIIPNCVVAKLFIEEAHLKTMHGGTSLTMALLRQKYWIINARNLIKQTVHKCLRCHRYNAKNLNQIMGNLPAVRVTPSRPFTHTGVDYAGPIQVRTSKGRGNKSHKGWIAIFICLATKAIHIELVSDLSSEGFLAAFKRFVSRRGLCSHIYSDNGTNFVGADKILQQELKRTILETQNAVTEVLAKDGTQWHFIPPASPHFGGLWEAGVKSIKHHLRRVIGETTLTFEEMTTMLTQIEACLNSRPLCPMTSDPTDLEVLTPGHFLIGSSLLSSPEPCLTQSSRLMRWQLVQKITQDFWAAWSSEYVSRMQQRPKWLTKQKNAEVGQLVLIKDEQFPPSRWPLGRIIKNHPGKDGLSRVVSIRTKDKEILRPIVKICPLPIKDNEDELPTNTNIKVNTITKNIKPTSSRTAKYEINPIIWMLTIIAVFTNVNSQQSSNYFTLQPFTSQPGIYFEHLGTTNMINNQWNIIVYYDLKNYQLEFEGYKNAVAQLTKLHDKLFVDMSIVLISQSILNQFEHHLSSMRAKNLILRSINKVNKTRTKRGLINAVGYVAHSLFGILDEDFAQQYEHEIKQIQSNEDHIFNLIKKQTSIVEATTNIIKKTEVTIQQQFKEFDEHIKGLSEDLQRMDEDLNKQEIIHQFSLLTMNTMLMMTNYEKTQDALTDLLLNIQNGKLPMQLLTYSQLDEQIEIIKANIPSDIKIPVINNPIEVFKLLSARARLFEEKIIIQIEVPLAQMDDFQLFHLIPVPTPHEDYFINILPSTKYLAVNLHRDHYYPLSESDFRDCTTTKIDYWLCRQSHAVYNLKSNVSSCEVAILNHDEHSPTCHIEASKVTRTWIQLQKTNSWIYVFNQRYTVDIICNKTIMSSNLEGSGILHLQSNCIIKESTMQIKSNNLYSSQIQESFYPSTNLSEIVQKHKVRIHQAKYQVFSLNNSREIEDLENKISLQKELETRKITEISHHDIHQYVILYLLLAGVFLAGIIIAVKKKKKKTTRTRANYNVPPLNMT